ncbi:MAG TPA: hypothetical protein VN918_10570, partial [Myxococcaceae bacterium]|nr:hypothetical protein [Myxococcaceae bacterium]
EYLRRAEQSLRAVLEQERDLSTLVRQFVRGYLLDRDPAQVAEPWFGDALEVALLASCATSPS